MTLAPAAPAVTPPVAGVILCLGPVLEAAPEDTAAEAPEAVALGAVVVLAALGWRATGAPTFPPPKM